MGVFTKWSLDPPPARDGGAFVAGSVCWWWAAIPPGFTAEVFPGTCFLTFLTVRVPVPGWLLARGEPCGPDRDASKARFKELLEDRLRKSEWALSPVRPGSSDNPHPCGAILCLAPRVVSPDRQFVVFPFFITVEVFVCGAESFGTEALADCRIVARLCRRKN